MPTIKHIGVLTGGGDAPGLNAVIRAVVKAATNAGVAVLGLEDSFDGLIYPEKSRPLTPKDVTGILRLGVFELSKRMEVPYKVVINECVELAKKYGATDDSYRFVNGILDKAARQLRALEVNAG